MPEHSTPPTATWSPARGVWLDPTTYLCGHSAPYSATFPTSGIARRGALSALPTSAPRTDASGCSSSPGPTLLPTPTVVDMGTNKTPEQWDEWTAAMQARHGNGNGHGPSLEVEAARLAPAPLLGTPRTSSGNGVGQYEASGRGDRGRLEAQVDRLLKTPNANLATNGGSQHPDKRKEGRHGPTLADEVEWLLPTPLTNNSKSARTMESGGQRQGGGHSGPPGLDETAAMLAGQRPAHLPPNDRLSASTRALVEQLLPTPCARDHKGTGPSEVNRHSPSMAAIEHLLPTPQSADASGGHMTRSGDRSHELLLPGVARALGEGRLLPTPTASERDRTTDEAAHRADRGPGLDLSSAAALLPTPTATDSRGSRGSNRDGVPYTSTSGVTLTDATERLLPTPRATRGGSSTETAERLLPMPTATDGTNGGPNQRGSSGDLMLPSAVQHLTDGDRTDPPWLDGRLF